MTEYKLVAHRNEIESDIPLFGSPNHTGYDLITIHDDGRVTIESLDLSRDGSKYAIDYRSGIAETYTVNGRDIIWNNKLKDEYISKYDSVQDYLTTKNAAMTRPLLTGSEALDAFNRARLDATIRNSSSQLPDGLLDYYPWGPNCNSWTNSIDQRYIQPNRTGSVFDEFGGTNDFYGSGDGLESDSDFLNNAKAKLIDKVVDILSDTNQGVNLSGIDADNIIWKKTGKDIAILVNDGDSIFVVGSNGSLEYDKDGNVIKGIENANLSLTDYQDLIKILLGNPNHMPTGLLDNLIVQKYISSTIADRWSKDYGSAEEKRSPLILDLNGDGVNMTFTRNNTCMLQSLVV